MLTGPRTGGRRPQLPFATAAPGAESPGVTRLSGIVTSTAPGLPAGDLRARMITRQLAVTRTADRHQRTTSLRRVNPAHRAAAGGASRNATEPLVTTSK